MRLRLDAGGGRRFPRSKVVGEGTVLFVAFRMAARCFVGIAFLLAAAAGAETPAPPSATADAAAIREPVERLYGGLLDVMKRADELGFEGRYRTLEPLVGSSYDVPFMAELILGRQWRELSPEQQKLWLETFTRLTVSTFADRFDAFSGERFEVGAVENGTQGTSVVRTKLVRSDGEPVSLDYRMRSASGGWRIIDVFLNGTVSELALRRSEYGALMRRDGFDALIEAVKQKIAAAEAGTSSDKP
jgi:phospholipid transport system substrate-binding protein